MLALQFRRRLHQYIRFRYAKAGKLQLGYKAAKKLVDSCYRVKEDFVVDAEGNPTTSKKTLCDEWDEPRTSEERELRDWLGKVPWKTTIRKNLAYVLQKVYDMIKWMEKFVEKHPKTKGARLYSLLPYSSSFVPSHVTLNASTLYDLFCRIYDDPEAKAFVNDVLGLECRGKEAHAAWMLNREMVFRKVFQVDELETSTRKFAGQVTTDGYAASVLLQREVRASQPSDDTPDPKKRKTNRTRTVGAKDAFDLALDKLPDGYAPDIMIGIDPGVRTLCTAACTGHLPSRQQRRQRNRRRKRSRRKNKPCTKNRHGQRMVSISTAEYCHLAKFDKHRWWDLQVRRREPWYAAVIATMPCFKTVGFSAYVERFSSTLWRTWGFSLRFQPRSHFGSGDF